MNRAYRIKKLAQAIKDYRGSYVPGTVQPKWIRPPQPAARERIVGWLEKLHVKDIAGAMKAIDGFPTIDHMRAWLAKLEAAPVNGKAASQAGITGCAGASSGPRPPHHLDTLCPPSP